jgi:hypothetical protein
MAEIILLWNVHPNESAVTYRFAKKLKAELESRGRSHTVRLEKILPKDTIVGKTRAGQPYAKDMGDAWMQARRQRGEIKDAFVIELHTTPVEGWKGNLPSHIRKWTTSNEGVPWNLSGSQIELMRLDYLHFLLELPAHYVAANQNLLLDLILWDESGGSARRRKYFERQASLKLSNAANFLSETVVRKAAHLIDSEIRLQTGKALFPRRPPHKYRKENRNKNPIPSGPEVWRTKGKDSRRNKLRALRRRLP